MDDPEDLFGDNYQPKPQPGFVYFLYSPGMRRMKIGRSRSKPLKRIAMLRTGSPDVLQTIMILEVDDWNMEGYLHMAARDHRSHGEWFHYPAMLSTLRWAFVNCKTAFKIIRFIGDSHPVGKELKGAATYVVTGINRSPTPPQIVS